MPKIAVQGFVTNPSRANGINNRPKCLGKPCWTFLPPPSSSNATSCVGIWTLHLAWARAAQICKIFHRCKTLIREIPSQNMVSENFRCGTSLHERGGWFQIWCFFTPCKSQRKQKKWKYARPNKGVCSAWSSKQWMNVCFWVNWWS